MKRKSLDIPPAQVEQELRVYLFMFKRGRKMMEFIVCPTAMFQRSRYKNAETVYPLQWYFVFAVYFRNMFWSIRIIIVLQMRNLLNVNAMAQ